MVTPLTETRPIIGEAPTFVAMLEQVSRVAPLSKPVLVVGERGTGKELIASRLHYLSGRWEQPLVKLNCSVLTESILESELFGHEAGAFTGAANRHIGRFERADGGTLFLDELATLPMRMQEKILRVVEYGEFERVGGSETIQVDVRTIGATNADLRALVSSGKFRVDLLDRLAFDVINIPPLRHRREDIMPLAEHFAVNIVRELGRDYFPGFTTIAEDALMAYPWPGNVRGLKNAVERSVYRSTDADAIIDEIVFDPFETPFLDPEPPTSRQPRSETAVPQPDVFLPVDLKGEVAKLEIELVERAMQLSRFRQPRAAELLGLSYHQLRALLRKHELVERYGRHRKSGA
ncbi:MAG: phage shock protein operon transcriptional activator [Gammaproteobacteria bacterium]